MDFGTPSVNLKAMEQYAGTFQTVAWTLGLASSVLGLALAYWVLGRGRKNLVRPSAYLVLLGASFLGIATALAADSRSVTIVAAGVAGAGTGVLGVLAGNRYAFLRRLRWPSVAVLLAGAAAILWGLDLPDPVSYRSPGIPQPAGLSEKALVTRVVDGDTVVVLLRGQERRVRYIGVDTPETVNPSVPVECFGKEASDFNERLVEGKTVLLERDVSQQDRYGRLLRYVWLDGEMANAILVREGYAQVVTYPPDVKYREGLLELERQAKEQNEGLWAEC